MGKVPQSAAASELEPELKESQEVSAALTGNGKSPTQPGLNRADIMTLEIKWSPYSRKSYTVVILEYKPGLKCPNKLQQLQLINTKDELVLINLHKQKNIV